MTNSNDHDQEIPQPRADQGHQGTPHQGADPAPLDVVKEAVSNLSVQEEIERQANITLAQRLEPYEPDLATALRLCASGGPSCNKRPCPRCSRARTGRLGSRYKARLARMVAPFHLTLTSYPDQDLTKDGIKQVRERFRLLRKRIKVEKKITMLGGVANLEFDLTEDGRWLPHIHAVVDAPVAPSTNWIRERWQALGGGQQVRLDPIVRGTQGTVFSYSTKPPVIPQSLTMLLQLVSATKGLRAVQPFGSFHPRTGKPVARRAPAATARTAKPPKPVFFKDLLKKDPVLRAEIRRLVEGGSRVQDQEARS